MESLFEQLGGSYIQQGDYLLPDLALPEEEAEIGIWGQRRKTWLRSEHRVLYYNLLTKGKLHEHLASVDREADEPFSQLVTQLAAQQGITEQLKAADMMAWVRAMNNIRNSADEIVREALIYA